ncbi:MAG: ATP-dependent Clp protease ATP-binding subunit ClpC [Actinomycetota bacterium]|jgi:ATP-dependent Clp protease ATP-binding subunit ClpC|nr:ATP-dependent Clp protease ATP-binding subunit ClpC [Actinomycetota bacterium]
MFERFTDRARRVVVLAQEEARLLNHSYIGTEHVLLGLIHEGEGVAAKALEDLGISLEAVRLRVEDMIGHGDLAPAEGHIPFTPRAKKVLELSLREALQLGHNYIGTEHILLGLVREGQGVAAQVLLQLGADTERIRHQVIQLLSGFGGQSPEMGGPGLAAHELRAEPVGRRLHLKVMGRRITISIDDPSSGDLPELDLVIRNPDLTPEDSRAIYRTVRNLVRQLDQRLADLEPHIGFDEPEAGTPD